MARPLRLEAEGAIYHVIVRVLTEAQVVSGVAGGLGMKPRELMGAGRQRAESRARLIAAYLGRAIGGIPVSRTAKYFGREESAFVRGVLRLEEKLRTDANLRRQVARVSEVLQNLIIQEVHG